MILRVLLPTDRSRGALDRQRIAQPVAEQVDADDQRDQREARDVEPPRLEEDHVLRLGDHQSPRGLRRLDAQAEERPRTPLIERRPPKQKPKQPKYRHVNKPETSMS